MKYVADTEKALFLFLATGIGRYFLARLSKSVYQYRTCFVTGPSKGKFHDEQRKVEE